MSFWGGIQSDYPGEGKWVQIVDLHMTGNCYINGSLTSDPFCEGALDDEDPYQGTNPIWAGRTANQNAVPFDDSPAATVGRTLANGIQFNIECTDYLMFKPDGGIWVPLGKTTTPWSVHCHAGWPSLDILPDNHVAEPGDLDSSTGFPEWTDIISNP